MEKVLGREGERVLQRSHEDSILPPRTEFIFILCEYKKKKRKP
jgi:hypothetical protein